MLQVQQDENPIDEWLGRNYGRLWLGYNVYRYGIGFLAAFAVAFAAFIWLVTTFYPVDPATWRGTLDPQVTRLYDACATATRQHPQTSADDLPECVEYGKALNGTPSETPAP